MNLPVVLVAEDDAMLRDLIGICLEGLACRVVTAADGLAALNLIRQEHPRVVLMDLLLPRLAGLDLLAALRSEKLLPGIHVIAISGLGFNDIVQQAILAGARDFLVKPFDVEDLQSRVSKALTAGDRV